MNGKYKFENYNNPNFPVYSSMQAGCGVLVIPHFHNAAEVIKILSGKVEIIIDTFQTQCCAGDIIFIPPYSLHSARSIDGEAGIRGLTFELPFLNSIVPDIPLEQLLSRERINAFILPDSRLDSCFTDTITAYPASSVTSKLELLSLLYQLTALLLQIYSPNAPTDQTLEYNRIKPVIDYIKCHYQSKIYISDLSRILNVCDDHFIRLFKAVTNKSPLQYIIHVRLEEAMKLLINTELSISEISDRVGFSNANYMSCTFKSILNMTPSEYRRLGILASV